MATATDNFGLDQFDDDFKPRDPFTSKFEDLPDGEYTFQITKAELTRRGAAQTTVLHMKVRIHDGEFNGVEDARDSWLRDKEAVARIGQDLVRLGFDADTWNAKNGKSFSAEFPKVVTQLPGIVFKGKKRSSSKDGKKYVNIDINGFVEKKEVPAGEVSGADFENDPF